MTSCKHAGQSCTDPAPEGVAGVAPLRAPLFELGRVVATPGALALLAQHGVEPLSLLQRHVSGDWGTVSNADARANDEAVHGGTRLLSSYPLMGNTGGDSVIWTITEADRSSTTLLKPSEY